MSFSGCAKITGPLRWLLLLGGCESSLPKIVLLPPAPGTGVPGRRAAAAAEARGGKKPGKKFHKRRKKKKEYLCHLCAQNNRVSVCLCLSAFSLLNVETEELKDACWQSECEVEVAAASCAR